MNARNKTVRKAIRFVHLENLSKSTSSLIVIAGTINENVLHYIFIETFRMVIIDTERQRERENE